MTRITVQEGVRSLIYLRADVIDGEGELLVRFHEDIQIERAPGEPTPSGTEMVQFKVTAKIAAARGRI